MVLRRQASNVERVAGLFAASDAIRNSPVVGYGSWAKSDEALETWAVLQEELGGQRRAEDIVQGALLSPEGATIRAHSMILQAWVEAGLPGLAFFGFSFVLAMLMFYRTFATKIPDRHYGLVCFFALWMLWAFVMSPFSGVSRVYSAISLALLFTHWPKTDQLYAVKPARTWDSHGQGAV